MNKQLTELIDQFEGAKREMNDIVSGISAEKFNERPAGGGWSIGECIDHLNVTDTDYTAQIEKGINEAKEKKLFTEGNYKTSWFAGKFIKNVEPPVKRRLKAPVKWTPHSELSIDKVTKIFIDLKGRYIELLKKSDGVNIGKIRIPSPATNLIKFPVFVLFKINAAHQRRHLWQAKNVKSDILK